LNLIRIARADVNSEKISKDEREPLQGSTFRVGKKNRCNKVRLDHAEVQCGKGSWHKEKKANNEWGGSA